MTAEQEAREAARANYHKDREHKINLPMLDIAFDYGWNAAIEYSDRWTYCEESYRIAWKANIAMAFVDNADWYKKRKNKKSLSRRDIWEIANLAADYFLGQLTERPACNKAEEALAAAKRIQEGERWQRQLTNALIAEAKRLT